MYSIIKHRCLDRLLQTKTAKYEEQDSYIHGMTRVTPVRSFRYRTRDDSQTGGGAGRVQPVTVPGDARTDLNVDQIVDATQTAERSRRNTQHTGAAAELAQQKETRDIGLDDQVYAEAQRRKNENNEQRGRKAFVDNWSGDYKRSVDEIYNDLASDRYTDSRLKAAKNWVARLFGSTDHEHQKTFKKWRGYTTEDADNSLFNGLWWRPDVRDADLDKLRAEAYRMRGQDRANMARAYAAEKQKYDELVGSNNLLTQIPDERTMYGYDRGGNVYRTVLERDRSGKVTEGDFNAAADTWAGKLLELAGVRQNSPLFLKAQHRLSDYVSEHRYDNATDGKTLPQILLDAGMSQPEIDAIMRAASLKHNSQYVNNRLFGDMY